jgi:cell division septation protein DedD
LFNGDAVARDWPRAYAYMSRAAAQGLPYAQSQLAEMERHLSDQDRNRGAQLARALESQAPTRVAAASPPSVPARPAAPPSRVATTDVPPSTATGIAPQPVRPMRPTQVAAAPVTPPTAPAAAGGRWRVQLGAFSSEANARRAWGTVSTRLPGLQPAFVRAGNLIRLQAGPLPNRAAADRACASLAGQACFPVAS